MVKTTDGEVQTPFEHGLLKLVGTHYLQVDAGTGRNQAKGSEGLRQRCLVKRKQVIDAAYLQELWILFVKHDYPPMKAVDISIQFLRRCISLGALFGKLKAALATTAEGVAEANFQISHQCAQARQAGI